MEGFKQGPKEHLQLSEELLVSPGASSACMACASVTVLAPDCPACVQSSLLSSIAHALIASCQLKALELEHARNDKTALLTPEKRN